MEALALHSPKLLHLALRGFQLHGGCTEGDWHRALDLLRMRMSTLQHMVLVDKPTALGPPPALTSCSLLAALGHLPALRALELHVGYFQPCAVHCQHQQQHHQQQGVRLAAGASWDSCLPPSLTPCGFPPKPVHVAPSAATSGSGSSSLPASSGSSHPSRASAPVQVRPSKASPPVGAPSVFPSLKRVDIQNGYQFNNWVQQLTPWLAASPRLAVVAVSTKVVDERLAALDVLHPFVELHLNWTLPCHLPRLKMLERTRNLRALTLGRPGEGVLLRWVASFLLFMLCFSVGPLGSVRFLCFLCEFLEAMNNSCII